ncbi:ribosomal-protein-alanine N-acetyltransferase [Catenulispora sp. GP43]|uniref:GNAT family N-acetyltransferase n=1 Tax=Catenulispora sp. GP43 TaxID=3156263 RepID=UPI0035146928
MTTIHEASSQADPESPAGSSLRLVREDDLPGLEVLDKEVFDDLAYSMHYLRTFFNLFSSTWYVADCGGELAGYALVGPSSDKSGAWLLGLAVSSGHQGRGLGSELMTKAMEVFAEADVPYAYITVRPDNAAAEHLYQKFGFRQFGEEHENYYGNGERRKVLQRSLVADPYVGG